MEDVPVLISKYVSEDGHHQRVSSHHSLIKLVKKTTSPSTVVGAVTAGASTDVTQTMGRCFGWVPTSRDGYSMVHCGSTVSLCDMIDIYIYIYI